MNAKQNQRVMFVDDEEGVRVSWNRYLSERGFDVTTADSGEGAISRLSQEPVDVVVSDLRMPGMDGLQLLEWLHRTQPATRFILLTGYGSDEVERKARELGAFGYLNKPISPEALSATITTAIQLDMISQRERERAQLAAQARAADVVIEAAEEIAELPVAQPRKRSRALSALRIAGGLAVAPILGLAFVIFLPVIGFGMLFWVLGQAIRQRGVAAHA